MSTLINVNSFKFVVIIPSAGTSERFTNGVVATSRASTPTRGFYPKTSSAPLPKQYSTVCDKPLIFHTVTAFLRLKWIDHIVVVAPKDSLAKMEDILSTQSKQQNKRFDCIPGGTSRHRSIKNAIDFIQQKSLLPDIVIVHDGARPYVDEETLHKLVTNCHAYGAAGSICNLTSTVISAKPDNLLLTSVLNRATNFASETPQAFRWNPFQTTYSKCTDHELDHNTECLDLVQRYCKLDAKLLYVDPSVYFKVTYRKDLYAADNILKEQRSILLHCEFVSEKQNVSYRFIKELKDDLCANFTSVKYFNNSVESKHSVNHSTGTVHVLLHYCSCWSTVMEQNFASYENLVYIVVDNELNSTQLAVESYSQLVKWAKGVVSKEIRNFYLIYVHAKNLDQDSLRIRKIVVYLSKELPNPLSGQIFFM